MKRGGVVLCWLLVFCAGAIAIGNVVAPREISFVFEKEVGRNASTCKRYLTNRRNWSDWDKWSIEAPQRKYSTKEKGGKSTWENGELVVDVLQDSLLPFRASISNFFGRNDVAGKLVIEGNPSCRLRLEVREMRTWMTRFMHFFTEQESEEMWSKSFTRLETNIEQMSYKNWDLNNSSIGVVKQGRVNAVSTGKFWVAPYDFEERVGSALKQVETYLFEQNQSTKSPPCVFIHDQNGGATQVSVGYLIGNEALLLSQNPVLDSLYSQNNALRLVSIGNRDRQRDALRRISLHIKSKNLEKSTPYYFIYHVGFMHTKREDSFKVEYVFPLKSTL